MPTEAQAERTIFACYRVRDFRDQVGPNEEERKFLQVLGERLGDLPGWSLRWDDHLQSGQKFHPQIQQWIKDAGAFIVLVGPQHGGSPYIRDHEFPAILREHEARGVPAFWVHLRTTDLQALARAYPELGGDLDRTFDALGDLSQSVFQNDLAPGSRPATADTRRMDAVLSQLCTELAVRNPPTGERSPGADPTDEEPATAQPLVHTGDSGFELSAEDRRTLEQRGRPVNHDWADLGDGRMDRLRAAVLSEAAVTGVVGPPVVVGEGGLGKSIAAAQLTEDPRILGSFPDGVYWTTLGRDPAEHPSRFERLHGDLVAGIRQRRSTAGPLPDKLNDLLSAPCEQPSEYLAVIRDLLRVSTALVVLDDVWDPARVRSLVPREGAGRVLVTSRSDTVVTGIGGTPVTIDRLDDALARRFLARLAGLPHLSNAESAPVIAAADGRPVRLAVYAGMIKRDVSWSEVSERIADHDRAWGPDADAEYRAHEVSVSQLESTQPGLAKRFWKLAIFPEDTPVPVHVVAGLWGADLDDALQSIRALLRAGLLSRSGAAEAAPHRDGAISSADSIQLHDVTLDFLIRRGPYPEDWHFDLVTWARSLVSEEHGTTRWSTLAPAERYLWGHLFHHLKGAGLSDEIQETVLDPNWIGGRVSVTGGEGMLDDLSMAERLALRNPAAGRLVAEAAECWRRDQHLILRATSEAPATAKAAAPRDTAAAVWSRHSTSATDAGRWDTQVRRLAGHDPRRSGTSLDLPLDGVSAVAWAPTGDRVAVTGFDCCIRVWDTRSNTVLAAWEAHSATVWGLAWDPDGRRLASSSFDRTIRVWDPEDGSELVRLQGHTGGVWSVGWSPDGTRLVSGSNDGTIRVWDPDDGTELGRLEGQTGGVWSVGWSPDGTRLVSGSNDGTIRVWDPDERTELGRLQGHTGGVWSVGWSPDGTRLVSGSNDGTIRVWDPDDGTELGRLQGHTDRVWSVGWSPDGTRLVSGSADGTIRVWDPEDGTELGRLDGQTGGVWSVGWSPDGTRLVSGSDDGTIRVWDPEDGTELGRLEGHTNTVSGRWGGHRMAPGWFPGRTMGPSGSGTPTMAPHSVVSMATPTRCCRWGGHRMAPGWFPGRPMGRSGCGTPTSAPNSAVSKTTPTGWHQAGFRVGRWDDPGVGPRRAHRTRPSRRPHRLGVVGGVVTRWHQAGFRVGRWDHPGLGPRRWHRTRPSRRPHQLGVVGGVVTRWHPAGFRVRRWDHPDLGPRGWHRTRSSRRPHQHGVRSVGWSPDGTRLVSGSADGTIRVWDPDDGTELGRLDGHTNDGVVGGVVTRWDQAGFRIERWDHPGVGPQLG
jgi:WD40 repeat protein